MKPLQKDEIFQNLSAFLKTKGVELKEGSYAQGIQKSCHLLAEAINLGQKGFEKAKDGVDRKLDQMRQVIHEKTAPRPPAPTAAPQPEPANSPAPPPPGAPSPPRAKRRARRQSSGRK